MKVSINGLMVKVAPDVLIAGTSWSPTIKPVSVDGEEWFDVNLVGWNDATAPDRTLRDGALMVEGESFLMPILEGMLDDDLIVVTAGGGMLAVNDDNEIVYA